MEEEVEAKLSDAVPDKAQRAAKEKELTDLRRQRGLRKAAVTRIRKTLEEEISAQATRDIIEEMNLRLKEAFAYLRKVQQLYEGLVEDVEIEDAKEYADRVEEECLIRGKVQQYLQQSAEARSSVATSRRSSRRAKSRVSAMSAASVRSREAALELDDVDQKLRDVEAQVEEERRNTKDRLQSEVDRLHTEMQSEKRRRQEQIETEMRQRQEQIGTDMRQRQEQIEMEKCRQQKQWELEERDRALQVKVAEETRSRAARKVHLYRAAESELNWDRRHDFEDPAAVTTERPRSTERGAQLRTTQRNATQNAQLPAGDMTKNAAKPGREMPREGGTPLNPRTWTSGSTGRGGPHS